MNDFARGFFKGMGSLNLFPPVPSYDELSRVSPWQGVADAFAKTWDNLRTAIDEFDAQIKEQPPK
jgi:hypothetical protein